MLVPCKDLNGTHRHTKQFTPGEEKRRRRLAAEEEMEVATKYFSVYGRPLYIVTLFKYIGRVMSEAENDWPEVVRNLARAKTMWRRMLRTLSREGAKSRVSVFF